MSWGECSVPPITQGQSRTDIRIACDWQGLGDF
jgi:hypothetical protein